MTPVLELRALSKHFRDHWTMRRIRALEGLDLDLRAGEILGLIGPNGAGKTTTFKVVLGLLRPSSGTVRFRGAPLTTAARGEIGFLPEQPYFYDYLTAREMLVMYGRLYGMHGGVLARRVDELVDRLELGAKMRAPLRSLSKGTLQRVGIAQAMLNNPRLLILDEPMSGLDPSGRHAMRTLIRSLRDAGTSVIFSSHILPDAEALCDRVAILVQGRLREVVDLRTSTARGYRLMVRGIGGDAVSALERLAGSAPRRDGSGWVVSLADAAAVTPALDLVRASGGTVESLVPVELSLEARFLSHVGHARTVE